MIIFVSLRPLSVGVADTVGAVVVAIVVGVTRVDTNEFLSAETTWPPGRVTLKLPALILVSSLVISCCKLAVVWPFLGTATNSTTILPAVKLKSCKLHSSKLIVLKMAFIIFSWTAAFSLEFVSKLLDAFKVNLTLTPALFGSREQPAVVGAAVGVGVGAVVATFLGPTNALRYPKVVQLHSTYVTLPDTTGDGRDTHPPVVQFASLELHNLHYTEQ